MRTATLTVICSLLLLGFSVSAQTRGGGHFASGGFSGRAVRSGPAMAARGAPVHGTHSVGPFFPTASVGAGNANSIFIHTANPFTFRGFPDPSDRFFFNPFVIHPVAFSNSPFFGFGHGRRGLDGFFGFGGFPFAGGFGFGGWPYYADYSAFNYDQNQQYALAQLAENERLVQQIQDDRQRQMELDQQLADQRAADALAARTQAPPPRQLSTATERVTPPTILVYRDHHKVEIGSYAITASTIFEITPQYTRRIQLSELDIPATIAANEQRGVQFTVPSKLK